MGLFKKSKSDRVVALVKKMRKNSSDMQTWKNVSLAKECIQLLGEIEAAEESPLGKALACEAIIEELPEYDMPRFVLSILRYEQGQLLLSDEVGKNKDNPTPETVAGHIQRLEDYIDTEHVSYPAFKERYGRLLEFDPIERSPQWEDVYLEVEEECDRRLSDMPRGMGFCHAYWPTRREVLAEHGIKWRSPHEMNPRVMFD